MDGLGNNHYRFQRINDQLYHSRRFLDSPVPEPGYHTQRGSKLLLYQWTVGSWTQVTIPNIPVTNGQCTIGFYSVAGAGQWLNFDDVELVWNW